MLEELRSQYQQLKWARASPYFGAMKIRGVISAARQLYARRERRLLQANRLLSIISGRDSVSNIPFPEGTVMEEYAEEVSFADWFGLQHGH